MDAVNYRCQCSGETDRPALRCEQCNWTSLRSKPDPASLTCADWIKHSVGSRGNSCVSKSEFSGFINYHHSTSFIASYILNILVYVFYNIFRVSKRKIG